MHIPLRTPALAALFAALVASTGLHASVGGDRVAMHERLTQEIGRAGQSYRTRQQLAGQYERALAHQKELLGQREAVLAYQEALRAERDALRAAWLDLRRRGMTADVAERSQAVRRLQQAAVVSAARLAHREELATPAALGAIGAARRAEHARFMRAVAGATDLTQGAGALHAALTLTESRLAASRGALLALNDDIGRTRDDIAAAEDGLISVRAITKDVHDQILRLQSALARIDAQLRSRSERELLELGLIDAASGHARAAAPQVAWPVEGPVSAGFKSAEYHAHFGVPHLGTDIAVPQGTVVRAAAEGIVFLVRDGGEKGYSYVLVGHRDGVATLYGHLFSFAVTAGQRVSAGQEIGRSGGTPGTYGAGPLTSGAHLHFEVIQGGENIDPLSVLPGR